MRIVSTDHKVIGLQYLFTSLAFLLLGFLLILLVRWQLAFPAQPLPLIGSLLGRGNTSGGIMLPEFFTQLGAMHGTIMVFLAVVPLAVGAFGNYLLPLMIGAPDMAFPRLNALSYWLYLAAGLVMLASFFLPGGAANSGWTAYPPLAILATGGQTAWLAGMFLLILSSLAGSINTIVTVLQLRAPGLTMMRLPFFVWAQLVTAFLLLLAFPPLQGAAVLQLMDRLAGTSFFLPSGLVISGQPLAVSGGGSPILWQHLFWFLAHPEVYVLILPAFGIVAEVIASATRRPLWGYRGMVGATLFMGAMSFLVWAHHMFLTGMGPTMSGFFQVTTMIISVPSVVILSSLLLSLYGGSIRFTVPALFALAFLPMFGIGGLTGLPLGLAASDIPLHDTNYVIGHFHYVVAPGTMFALFAGVYYWFPKVTGRQMHTRLGQWHFWGTLIAMNGVFMPMFIQGLAGVNRRLYDGGRSYAYGASFDAAYAGQWWSAVLLGVVQLFFIANLFVSLRRGARTSNNPWQAVTLEWTTTSPPPAHNFETTPTVHRGAYEYSVPGATADFVPQDQAGIEGVPGPGARNPPHDASHHAVIPYTNDRRPDTGVSNVTMGIWLFLASEVMLFGAMFSAYALLRVSAPAWPNGWELLSVTRGLTNTGLLILMAAAIWRAGVATSAQARRRLWLSSAIACLFLLNKGLEYRDEIALGLLPSTSTFLATYFTLTGLHALHVAAGLIANLWAAAGIGRVAGTLTAGRLHALRLYWAFVDVVWLIILVLLYLS
jgi:cytochrome c oxidase subunit I